MVLENYVILQPGVPGRLHFSDHIIMKRTITDPITGGPTARNVLIFEVDEFNGKPATAKYSIMAEKHAGQFAAYLDDKSYRDYDFIITPVGEGFMRTWSLQVLPRQ